MRTRSFLLPGLLALAACAGTPPMSASAPAAPSASERLDPLLHDYAGDVPGAAVLVLKDGRAVVRRGTGLADLEAGTAVTPQTHFRLASVSKQLTAAAVLLLAQDGRLSLDDKASKWLPSLPPAAHGITLRHLLTHSSGIVDYEDLMAPDATEQVHDADVLRLLEGEDRLYFQPGTGYRYSNSGYALLALIVGNASGQRFADFLRTRIFEPLGMTAVAYEEGLSTVPHRAYGHSLEDGRWVRTDQSSTSAVLGDGGIYASIDDLAKWDAALYDDRLLSDALRADAFALHTPIHDETDVDGYGYGWRIGKGGSAGALWHSGETIGFRNVIVRWPEEHLTVVVLTNRNAPEPYPLALKIAALYR